MNSSEASALVKTAAERAITSATVRRSEALCYVLAFAHFCYGFTSLGFINVFRPDVTILQNFFPRLILNVIPFVILGIFIRKSRVTENIKLLVYVYFYSIMFFVAACVYVWPTAIFIDPTILVYVGGINTAYLCSTWTVLALPNRMLHHLIISVFAFIIAPLSGICLYSGNIQLTQIVLSDTIFAAVVGIGLGMFTSTIFEKLELLRAQQEFDASRFMSDEVKKAVFEQRPELLEERECTAYIMMFDIRSSTKLTRKYGPKWSEFNKAWLAECTEIIRAYGGSFVKSTGDGVLAAFGIFDDEDIVNDLPGLEQQNKEADEFRWIGLTVNAFGCIEALMLKFNEVSRKYFPDEVMRAGCGLDRGKIMRGVRGGSSRKEFDIWGDKVNTAAKLESLTKDIAPQFSHDASLLAVSPFAADFLNILDGFKRVTVTADIRGSLDGINWVLVREYSRSHKTKLGTAA